MKDGGRIAAAIEVLEDVERTRRPVQDALKDWGLKHRFAGSRDRSAIGNLVFDALRCRASLSARIGSETPRLIVLAAYARVWGKGLDALDAALSDDRHSPVALSDGERQAIAAESFAPDTPRWKKSDVPEWLEASLVRAFGDRFEEEGAALAGRADVDIRVNRLKSDRATVLGALDHLGAAPCPLSPVGIRIPSGGTDEKPPHVASELAYKKGWFEIQDEGSQLAALMAGAEPGQQVIDLCAGAGGKSLALAAEMENRGQIYAYDSDRRRFGDILERIARSGAHNIQIREPKRSDVLSDLSARMDVVLVDAPCTGSGTWRRRPDAKWRLAPGALEMRQREQAAVLSMGAGLVKPGGRLVYVTCSVLPEENEDRVADFLAERPEFALADGRAAFRAVTGADPDPRTEVAVSGGIALRLTPLVTNTDGFFCAILERRR